MKTQTKTNQKEVPEGLNQIDLNNMGEVLNFIKSQVHTHVNRFFPNRKDSIKEIIWDCYTYFVEKGFFQKYDSSITNKLYFLKIGIRNYLIDQERKASRKVKTLSGDREYSDGVTIFDFIESSLLSNFSQTQIIEDAIMLLKSEKSWGEERVTPELGLIKVSHYSVLLHYLRGYKTKELARIFTLSMNRVSDIIEESINLLINKYNIKQYLLGFECN